MKTYIFLASAIILLFSACSTKEVFEPKKVANDWEKYADIEDDIVDIASNAALLGNGKILGRDGNVSIQIDSEYQRVLGESDGWVLSATIDGNLTVTSQKTPKLAKHFELKRTIATAGVKDNILAVLFANNEIALYDMDSKELLFKEQGGKALANDIRIVQPYFMNDLVIFSTLDGKIVIVNSKLKKRLRTVIVSSDDYFNNIIYFSIFGDKIIASSDSKILALSQKEVRAKFEVRNIVHDDKNIFITTKQGEIISLTPSLQVDSKVKFPFAHFLGMISDGDNLYVLEKEGYMIVVNKKTFDYTIHEVDLNDGLVFVGDKAFYVDNEKILIK
ncbi:hypothetical protein [Sulfurimonas autotrophica]|uniref:Lipoprotein n=1 Tax=Sulfurimonas autotrophica (strain ATCC BAA-671 / DSM 16294 / JCM 11897 / OK10) TaxID=563040 RepID=E0UTW6_SULAO|nr:hypothetical protein [Sulfurimonas autotrophica]ADN09410.1 conserved hypothetical protein [Sulfurimonas autotrophica DSM 16294]